MKTRTYNPGTPGTITSLGHGRFQVESFRNRGEFYQVDLTDLSCSCPHFAKTGACCKHISEVRAESHKHAMETARTFSGIQLRELLARHTYRPEIADAIKAVLFERLEEMMEAA